MKPVDALRILIENSSIIDKQKQTLLRMVDQLSEEEIVALGKALAEQKKSEQEQTKAAIQALDEFIDLEPPKAE